MNDTNQPFNIIEATIESVHSAYRAGQLTVRQLVQMYLDRIEAFDKKGPAINAIISINPLALGEAERLDAAFKTSGFVGPLHGIPVIMNLTEMNDQDAKRLVDFAAGLIFATRGTIERVTNKVFLLSPPNVTVAAEDKERIAEGGFFNQS